MDDRGFDQLSRTLARTSRRAVLRGVTVGAVVGFLTRLGPDRTASAQRCPTKQACFDVCCPPETVGCFPPQQLPDGTVTGASCLCADGFVYDHGTCVPCKGEGCPCGDGHPPCCEGVCCDGRCHPPEFVCCGGTPCCIGFGMYVCDRSGACVCSKDGGQDDDLSYDACYPCKIVGYACAD